MIKNNEFDDDWEKYISRVEAAPKEISVNGIDPYEYALLDKKEKEFTEFIPKTLLVPGCG